MRVLVNGYGAYFGGIVRVHNSIARELLQQNDVFVANAPRDQATLPGATVLSRQGDSRLRSLLVDLLVSLRFMRFDVRIDTAPALRFFTSARWHAVVVHDLNFLMPTVHQISWKQLWYRRLLHLWTLRRVDCIVVNSPSTAREVAAYMPSVASKVLVLPLPVDYMSGSSLAQHHGNGTRLMTFGHARNKGVDRLLEALRMRESLELTVVSPPDAWSRLWSEDAAELVLAGRVRVVGPLTDEDLRAEYLRADVFCMLSTYEGYGLPAAEALYLGLPTVISDLAVLRDTTRGHAVVAQGTDADAVLDAVDRATACAASHWDAAARDLQSWTWASWVDSMLREAS